MKSATHLLLSDNQISCFEIEYLSQLTQLEELSISTLAMTQTSTPSARKGASILALPSFSSPPSTSVSSPSYIADTDVTGEGMVWISRLTQLKKLYLRWGFEERYPNADLHRGVMSICKSLTELTHLQLCTGDVI